MKGKALYETDGRKTYSVILDTGDEVAKGLADFAEQKVISAASLTEIGARRDLTLGYFD